MIDLFVQQLVNGLALGSTYALVALGLTLIFGVLLIPNFAHGEFYMLGAFLTYAMVLAGMNFWLAMALAVGAVILLGCLVDRLAFKPVEQAPPLSMMISALAASIILQQSAMLIWGGEARTIPAPVTGVLRTPFFIVTWMQLIVMASLLLAAAGVWLVLNRSRLGLAIRAVAQNRDAALLMGISMFQVRLATFAIGAALGAIAGALLGATFPIYPTMGVNPVLKAFVVLVLGGIGSLPGAVFGGLFLGVVEVMVAGYISSELSDIGAFAILVAVLLLRPQGFFGQAQVER
ncbi:MULTISPECIES: branched-chain amino acid ABC transporter permease [Cereibacter]|jgi:branched-chain amino acid transport system permease protein|uniref:Branched-chain amino acid ABC transporter permease n=1 Tax=Cereibacter sphaeroides TaxID=1063 RepID=A0AAX1UGG4_CERSP|nr:MULTISPECIES: branched-chain amino acid ABC transporter permease [Cereibacter]ABN78643.1 inner-membrane translocator [Cereibacter sphaeroides ATCC 17029]EKX57984.1 High-affinity branched-chain amino acid transport system permease protein LivH [Rhodobacter sp. AKP1]RDS96791.1 branched-chain amino acid ABC transporter permease [Cereibacter sphaeroides f. sp. denitrificans]ACM04060.1 Inner-membrane translocator precursor [Cereibacter sphaeroides KD131]AZB61340.1 branched-chain amino acid ABC t